MTTTHNEQSDPTGVPALVADRPDPRSTFPENAADPDLVVAFDTDRTMAYAAGCVPLDHVEALRDHPAVSVWATGFNQSLRYRAEIPGMAELKAALGVVEEFVYRARRLRLLAEHLPDADRYVVVDDVDLSELEPDWEYHTPWDYATDVLGIDTEAEYGRSFSGVEPRPPFDPDNPMKWRQEAYD